MQLTPAQRQTLSWLLIAFIGALLVWLLAPVLTPFLFAGILAYILEPAVGKLVKRRVPRVLAVTLVEVAAFIVILSVLLLIVPIVSKELPLLREQLPLLADKLNTTVTPWLAKYGIEVALDVASIKAFLVKYLDANVEDGLAAVLSSARIGGSFLLALIGNAVLVPAVLFYLLMDWPQLIARIDRLVPPRLRDGVRSFMRESDEMLGQYLRGQLLVMVILAAFYSVGLALFGFDLAVPVGVFTGLAVFIPYLGYGLGMLLALIAGVLQFASWYGVIAVAVVYGLGQVIESFFLTPRLVGERIGINPLTVIFALLAFGHLAGFVGVLLALPVCAVLVVAGKRVLAWYTGSKLYLG
ncbi:AI-2E family transporter [Rhizobacter sp. J219]|jgi:predicted PurR-regulated permease PerM|uniref:AI-2E family transporter n=1 Tax=Rhizobacter sp. J219 TaxID=2898430 RepID=UPI002150D97B|nr:AI-2E family transporter [Rhizobacter sp. J219]MCR5881388.1 AI-2E family transporter [Rhizobacter sp. J219]